MNTYNYSKSRFTKKYIFIFVIAVVSSWILHELAHWAVGEYLGYEMEMTLNGSYPLNGKYDRDLDYQFISAGGVIFTLFEATLVFVLMTFRNRIFLYPFLFTCFYMRLLATIISLFNPNDEARISDALGWGKFTLPLIVTGFLFILVYRITKLYKFDIKFNLGNSGLVIIFSSVIILMDMFFKIRLL